VLSFWKNILFPAIFDTHLKNWLKVIDTSNEVFSAREKNSPRNWDSHHLTGQDSR